MEPLFKINGIFPAYSPAQEGFNFENITDNFAYIIDNEGWKLFKKNGVSSSLIDISKIEGVPNCKEYINLTVPKIPLNLIRRVTAFFAAVYKKNKTEAVGYLYYNATTNEWNFIPPVQTCTSASANYEKAPKIEGYMIAGTIHSHGSMTAFHSGTDHKDEAHFDGVHITIGKLDDIPEYSCSIVSQGARVKFDDPADLIDGMASMEEIPPEWMEMVKLSAPKSADDDKIGEKIDELYKKYFNGEISEEDYLKKLKKLEAKIDEKSSSKQSSFPPAYGAGYFTRHNGRWGGV